MADYPEVAEIYDGGFREDPYGTFVALLREITAAAVANQGSMSQQELTTVNAVSAVMDAADPLWR